MIQTEKYLNYRNSGLAASAARPIFPCSDFAQHRPFLSAGKSVWRKDSGQAYLAAAMVLGGTFPVLAVSCECKEEFSPVIRSSEESFSLTLTADISGSCFSPAFCEKSVIAVEEKNVCVKFSGIFDAPDCAMSFDSLRMRDFIVSVTAFRTSPARSVSARLPLRFSRRGNACRTGAGRGICINNHQFNL